MVCAREGVLNSKNLSAIARKFQKNSRRMTPPDDKGLDFNTGDIPVERTLGVHGNIENGYLDYKINLKDNPITRQGMLSTIRSNLNTEYIHPILLSSEGIVNNLLVKSYHQPVGHRGRG